MSERFFWWRDYEDRNYSLAAMSRPAEGAGSAGDGAERVTIVHAGPGLSA